jgi:hypothetical protein
MSQKYWPIPISVGNFAMIYMCLYNIYIIYND